jgi:hypothetical protein
MSTQLSPTPHTLYSHSNGCTLAESSSAYIKIKIKYKYIISLPVVGTRKNFQVQTLLLTLRFKSALGLGIGIWLWVWWVGKGFELGKEDGLEVGIGMGSKARGYKQE